MHSMKYIWIGSPSVEIENTMQFRYFNFKCGLTRSITTRFITLLFASVMISGCQESAPPLETWPVQGTVVDQNGKAVSSGAVRFMTDADPQLITAGPIEPNGSFTVKTQRMGHNYEGAVEGPYELLILTAKEGQNGIASPVQYRLSTPFVVKAESNTFNLKIRL